MRTERRISAIGLFATQRSDPFAVAEDVRYTSLGVKWYAQGVFARNAKLGSEIKGKTLFKVRPGQFVYNRMFATEGSFAVVQPQHAGAVVSNEFPLFDIDQEVALTAYLYLYFQQPSVWAEVAKECVGTTKSRSRWKEDRFLSHELLLPTLSEQRRIVDLIGSLDEAIEAADDASRAAEAAMFAIVGSLTATDSVSLGRLATMRSGPSWKSSEETAAEVDGASPVLSIGNTRPDGSIDMSERKFVTGIAGSAMRLTQSSLVMIRTNGNRNRIGNIYRTTDEIEGYAVSAFQIAIEPNSPEDADYIFWSLASKSTQEAISGSASGSTGLGNVAIGWLKKMEIPFLSDPSERGDFVRLCGAAELVRDESRNVASALRILRAEVLAACLSGVHEIPESYDDLIPDPTTASLGAAA